jgi:hypothetical protein
MTAANDKDLGLLLCDADERAPVLAAGLPESALLGAPTPERGPRGKDSMHLEALDQDPNDLAAQRWAVIAPEGEAGDAAIAAIRSLIEHRRDQQGADPRIYRVPDGMDSAASLRWKHDVLRSEDVAADERPRYLLILGDLDRVSLELQHVLANGSFVGRLHCPTIKGYRSYAEKVVARERTAQVPRPRALYYTAQDGSAAIGTGFRHLVEPSMRMTSDLAARGKLVVDGPTEVPYSEWGPDELLAVTGVDTPSLLVSLSHGLGAPRRGWRSPEQQRALQGALSLGTDEPLTADMLRESPFLPGGIWMCVACYGAGTPPTSAFHPWLSLLAEQGGNRDQASAVLRALPKDGERPFVAALPQALLANPSGPLAVIGHMDLAWTFGFTDPGGKQSRASRLHATQRAIVGGSRVGVGLDALMHAYREINDELMARYQTQRDALARGQSDPVDPRQLGDGWMQRNDLRGYVLLGDPAARLGVAGGLRTRAAEASDLQDRARPAPVSLRTAETPPPPPPSTPAAIVTPATPDPPPPAAIVTPAPPPGPIAPPATPDPPPPAAIVTPAPPPGPIAPPAPPAPAPIVTPAAPDPIVTPAAPDPIVTPAAPDPMATPAPSSAPPAAAVVPVATSAQPASPEATPAPSIPASPRPLPTAPYHVSAGSPMSTTSPPSGPPFAAAQDPSFSSAHPPAASGAAPLGAITRPRTLENPEIGLRERAVLAMLRGDEAPRSIAVRFGLPLEEIFYWLDVYREAGRRALGG